MTDYAKHIERLENAKNDHCFDVCESLTAAIELMRAAAPKSPEEERRHCESAYTKFVRRGRFVADNEETLWLERERAAARAEG